MKTLELKQIRIDGGTQPRVEMDQDVLAEYAELLRNGTTFPPVTVFFDGVAYWLADGFHRYHAHRMVGHDSIAVDGQDGGLREAILYSVGANTEHGLRRTNEDKRKAVETMLTNDIVSKDNEGIPRSDRGVAKLCRVHHGTVSRIRKELSVAKRQIDSSKRTVKRGNSTYTQNIAKIGKASKKRKKKYGGIAPDAFTPVRPTGQYEPKAAIELPYKPVYAAKTIVSVMGQEMAVEIANQILQIAKGN